MRRLRTLLRRRVMLVRLGSTAKDRIHAVLADAGVAWAGGLWVPGRDQVRRVVTTGMAHIASPAVASECGTCRSMTGTSRTRGSSVNVDPFPDVEL